MDLISQCPVCKTKLDYSFDNKCECGCHFEIICDESKIGHHKIVFIDLYLTFVQDRKCVLLKIMYDEPRYELDQYNPPTEIYGFTKKHCMEILLDKLGDLQNKFDSNVRFNFGLIGYEV